MVRGWGECKRFLKVVDRGEGERGEWMRGGDVR